MTTTHIIIFCIRDKQENCLLASQLDIDNEYFSQALLLVCEGALRAVVLKLPCVPESPGGLGKTAYWAIPQSF